jgi:hypothetical protein
MALLEGLTFTGTLGDFSAYRMRGSDKIVIRKKGGARKEQIRNDPRFATARLYMTEFGGCSRMGKHVRLSMNPIKGLANYNISGPINKIMKVVQKQDDKSDLGRRAIRLSKHPKLIEGFSLNQKYNLDSILRSPVTAVMNREAGTAHLEIPRLMRDINLFPLNRHAMFRIEVTLGIAPDFIFNSRTGQYEAPDWYDQSYQPSMAYTAWHSSLDESPEATLDVALTKLPPQADYSFVLSIGIRFGSWTERGVVKEVKGDGAAKILLVQSGHAFGNADSGKPGNGPATEAVRLQKEKKQRSSRKELSLGKVQKTPSPMSDCSGVDHNVVPILPSVTTIPYAATAKPARPKKQKTFQPLATTPASENASIYKEREEAYLGQYGYYSTMTLAMNTRVVYVHA